MRYARCMRMVALAVMVVACGGSEPSGECTDGATRECYQGPLGTEGVGPCVAGIETCVGGRFAGFCVGDVVPLVEHCDGIDEDCSGEIDDVVGAGGICSGADGCEGAMACVGDDVDCVAPARNECGVCGGAAVADVGGPCSAGNCSGQLVCNTAGDATECNAAPENACELCGGPVVIGLGDACASADSCAGTNVCNTAGDAAVCNAPLENECGLCGGPPVAIGATCSGDRGCVGVTACNTSGDAAECLLDSPCGHVVISELSTRSAVCSTDELIELYNPTARAIPLDGYTLRSQAVSSGNFTRLITFPAGTSIASHGFLLVASSRGSTGCSPGGYTSALTGNTVAADRTYAAVDIGATAGQIWLTTVDQDPTSPSDAIVVDLVGYGTVTSFEGAPAPAPPSGGSIERVANPTSTSTTMALGGGDHVAGNGQDADTNAADFVVQVLREPQNAASTVEP